MRGISSITDPGGSALIRKSPVTNFASRSILQVPPHCKALVDINGRLLLFEPGMHELQTGLNPIFSGLQNWKSHGIPTISAHVYFFNVDRYSSVEFYTEEIVVTDLDTRLPLHISGYGVLRVKIQNPEKLFELLHGNGVIYTTQMLAEFLSAEISPTITEVLAEQCNREPFIQVNSKVKRYDPLLTRLVGERLNECGLSLELAALTKIDVREEDMQRIAQLIGKIEEEKIPTTTLIDLGNRACGGDIEKAMWYKLMEKYAAGSGCCGMNPVAWKMGESMMNEMSRPMQGMRDARDVRETQDEQPNASPPRKKPHVISSTVTDKKF